MTRILTALICLALFTATAEARPHLPRKAAGAVLHDAGKVLKRAAHPFRRGC